MKHRIVTMMAVTALALGGSTASAQEAGVSFEVRGGWDFPLGNFSDAGANSEAAFGGDVILNLTPMVSVYGGWGGDQFDCDGCVEGDDLHSSGFEGGLKLLGNWRAGALPWIRAGATYHKLAGEFDGTSFESDSKVGFQASIGIDVPLGQVLSIVPAVRFQTGSAVFPGPFGIFQAEQDVRYLAVDLGAHFHIP